MTNKKRWPYLSPLKKTEFAVNPGVNRYYVAQCLRERHPNMGFHIIGEDENIITTFGEITELMKSTIENDIQVLCIAYKQSQEWEW